MDDILPDLLAPGLDVVFVGAAPSLWAAETGHYYAGPRNRFWALLHQSGFTPVQLREEEDVRVLEYGVGLTGLMKRVASSDNTRLPPPTEVDREALWGKLRRYAPRFVCYNGKDVFRMCHGHDAAGWGIQPDPLFGTVQQFVVYSTSGRADGWGAERLWLFHELKRLVDARADERKDNAR